MISLLACLSLAAPAELEHEVDVVRDLAYFEGEGADERFHSLDLYLPVGVEGAPILIWIHGGAWAVGDRSEESGFADRVAKQGVACAVINYRLSPATWMSPDLTEGIEHPEHVVDCARATAWVHDRAGEYGYSAEAIFVSGYSAGAQLSALLATDDRYLKAVGLGLGDLRAAIPVAGAYDLEHYHRLLVEGMGRETADAHVYGVFGEAEGRLVEASPATWAEKSRVPMLIVSETQTYDYTRHYEELVEPRGWDHLRFHHVRDLDHAGLLVSMRSADDDPTRKLVVEYVRELSAPAAE